MPEHYSLSYHEVGFLIAKHQSFPNAYLQYLRQVSKTTFEVVSKDGEIIYEDFYAIAKKVGEDSRHTSLEGRGGVAQSEWHASEGEGAKRTCEHRLLLIVGVDSNLIVARISVEKAEVVRSCQSVQNLVDEW